MPPASLNAAGFSELRHTECAYYLDGAPLHTLPQQKLVGQRHFRPSFNRKPNGLRELRRDLITRVVPRTHPPMAMRLNELRYANVVTWRCPISFCCGNVVAAFPKVAGTLRVP